MRMGEERIAIGCAPVSALRVRFCPSPTGLLHVGGVRTALYNWLYARRRSGVMVLRIEDTDEARENPEAIEQIQRSLRWCGLDWDEGPGVGGPHEPYLQSERRPLHLAAVARMLEEGAAYRCYCTSEELDAERKAAQAAGLPTVYSRKCRWLTDEQRAELEAAGRRPAIRLAIPEEGEVVIDDLVRGEIRFENALLGDHVIVRSDGVPTYNLVNPLDDAAMGITHVIRGDDLLPSTPRQVHVYRAIGAEIPRFAHLSMILGPNRQRLSKRDGAASVEQLRDAGYLPEAVVNYLALLGWSLDGERELFTLDELAGLFSLERVNPAPAVFDHQKLLWMNGVHIRALSQEALSERLVTFLRESGSALAEQPERIVEATPLVHEKIATLAEFESYCGFLFGSVEIEPEALERLRGNAHAGEVLAEAETRLAALEHFEAEPIEQALRSLADELGLKHKAAFAPIRIALCGRTVAPGLFESAALLGRDEVLSRLRSARSLLA
jgi:glutamyl-tRNA synthetase